MSTENVKKALVIQQAWSFLGKPYIWGGDDPVRGFDCSGFIVELLKSIGKLPRNGDWTANDIWSMFNAYKVYEPYSGCLVFWSSENNKNSMVHIELCLTDEESIGASGGGSKNLTEKEAIEKNAYIKIRPIYSRDNVAGFIDIFTNPI